MPIGYFTGRRGARTGIGRDVVKETLNVIAKVKMK